VNSQTVIKIGLYTLGALAVVLGFISCIIPSELVSLTQNGHDGAGLKDIHLILPDDVMITMRVSKFFLAHGYPGFNLSDLSQPSSAFFGWAPYRLRFPNLRSPTSLERPTSRSRSSGRNGVHPGTTNGISNGRCANGIPQLLFLPYPRPHSPNHERAWLLARAIHSSMTQ